MGIDPDVQPFLDEPAVKATTATAPRDGRRRGAVKATAATAVLADKVAALEARIAKLETPTPPPVTSERFEAVDFAKANAGHLFTGT